MAKSLYDRYFGTVRTESGYKPVAERLRHFHEFRLDTPETDITDQAQRCMTCGIPFCHNAGCPLGNPIPETNAFTAQERGKEACDLLHAYDNFPEFTGRLCPALCEASCVHALNGEAVTIRQLELETAERGWRNGWIQPLPAQNQTGKKAAVIGSGPAGLAAAQQLARAGHSVTVFEQNDKPGGILRYGIPDFKLEKNIIDRRLNQMRLEGVLFETDVHIGTDISPQYLKRQYDAIVLAGGSMEPRDLTVPGRDTPGIHFAMDYLIASNRAVSSSSESAISAKGKKVVVLGGGDTGADCVGAALRQGAKKVVQMEIMPKPPEQKNPATPWPRWSVILRTGTSHKEAFDVEKTDEIRRWSVSTKQFLAKGGKLQGIEAVEVDWVDRKPVEKSGSGFKVEADLILLALGFVHPKHDALLLGFGVDLDIRGNVNVDSETRMTNQPGIFAAGDMQTGASLVVRCIQSGRVTAYNVDKYLMGSSGLIVNPSI
ncbi:MAG: glutamate synthase subunit beta [Planctomycetaceae bacterium]|jgi:glutamate synthase (NADPH/NADH) small chain|nr:glutamate synthase subunit beta [Planctomycetaceae bacterium]